MPNCASCGTHIFFGGVKQGTDRYCNDNCFAHGQLMVVANQIPAETIANTIREIHAGSCPVCHGRGPVDLHVSHRIWSALVLTSWQSRPRVSCRSCAAKAKFGDMLFSGVLGWWGFPWGIIGTPIQIGRNFFGLFTGPGPLTPSPQFTKFVTLQIAANAVEQARQQRPATPPPIPGAQG